MTAERKTKRMEKDPVWRNDPTWVVRRGKLVRPQGNPGIESLFAVVAEKIPFAALPRIEADMKAREKRVEGVYIAHDSMGCARYIGRGSVFSRLSASKKAHKLELAYFSFYIVANKKHGREIETLLIRAASPILRFNERKKRADIRKGNITDYEGGTEFYERQRKKGKKRIASCP